MTTLYPGFLPPDHAGAEGELLEQCTPIQWPEHANFNPAFVSALLSRLLSASFRSPDLLAPYALGRHILIRLLALAKDTFSHEPNIVDIPIPTQARVHIFGDTHGDFHSFIEALSLAGWPNPHNILCFAGDCVDRGAWGVEVLAALFALKLSNPHSVFVLRGNHETTGCTKRYGFQKEVLRKYDNRTLLAFFRTFKELPGAALIRRLPRVDPNLQRLTSQPNDSTKTNAAESKRSTRKSKRKNGNTHPGTIVENGTAWNSVPEPGERRILVVHGGLFRSWQAKKKGSMELGDLRDLATAHRRAEDPYHCIMEDVLWSDPQVNAPGVAQNELRGAGILFGSGAVSSFFKRNHLHGLIRAHEGPDMRERRPEMGDMLKGFSVDMDLAEGFVATVFSSSAYPPDRPRLNKGAFATLSGAGLDRIQTAPAFTQFEKRKSPSHASMFFSSSDADQSATPRTSVG